MHLVSDEITSPTHQAASQALTGIAGILERSRENGPMRDVPLAFVVGLASALADTTIGSSPSGDKAYIVTGPTSGIGRQTALELTRHGTVVLVAFIKYWSNPKTAARVITRVLTDDSDRTERLLRRKGTADERVHARARAGIRRTRGRRDPRPARTGSCLTGTARTNLYPERA